jgi:hypothetical protein
MDYKPITLHGHNFSCYNNKMATLPPLFLAAVPLFLLGTERLYTYYKLNGAHRTRDGDLQHSTRC